MQPIDFNISSIRLTRPTYIGFNGYELTVTYRLPVKEYKKYKGLGSIVVDLNNWLYRELGFAAYNPSVNSKIRSKNGIKTLTFSYMFDSKATAEHLGFTNDIGYIGLDIKFKRSKPALSLVYSDSSKVA